MAGKRLGWQHADHGAECADQTLDWGPSNPDDPRQTKHVNPCMSTGFWFVQPTEAAKRFMRDFIQIAVYELTEEVDQIVWNEVSLYWSLSESEGAAPAQCLSL